MQAPVIPVVLFAYARPDHTRRTLEALRANGISLLYAYLDGPRPETREKVAEVAGVLAGVDWCEVRLIRRAENWGLGRSIRAGVAEVLEQHEAIVVFEDDLVCAPETYSYFCAALDRYRNDPRVMSVTAYTHPRVTPPKRNNPYFDGRCECWGWGTWRRAWKGMDQDAVTLLGKCRDRGISPARYGGDLEEMALAEGPRNLWAIRFILAHLLEGGLCLRPPHSLIQNIGFGPDATNCGDNSFWAEVSPLKGGFEWSWPEPRVEPECARLWRRVYPNPRSWWRSPRRAAGRLARKGRNLVLGGLRKGLGIDLRRKPDGG